MWIFWLIAAGIFFIAEMMTTGFLVFWFGLGSIAAMVTSFFTANVYIQATVFLITSTILILLTKPIVNKYISKKDTIPTNVYSVIGKIGFVTKTITPEDAGLVKVNGEVWTALSENFTLIEKDTEVEIVKIEGVKLIVTPVKK